MPETPIEAEDLKVMHGYMPTWENVFIL